MNMPKNYEEILKETAKRLNGLLNIKHLPKEEIIIALEDLLNNIQKEIKARVNYEMWLDEETAKVREEYNIWKEESKNAL